MRKRSALSRRDFLASTATLAASAALGGCTARRGVAGPAAGGGPGELLVYNGRITTQDPQRPEATAFLVRGGRIAAVGDDAEVVPQQAAGATVVDAGGRRVIPGLIDSHLHIIRGGLNYNLELRWDGLTSLADGLEMIRRQAQITPPPQWVRVVGGFCEFQFTERRLPTLDELNAVAPDTPVFVLHLYDRALLNRAALRAVGYTKDTPDPPGGVIERDGRGNPTGLLVARPNAFILYKTLSLGPVLGPEDRMNSSRHFMREMNRLGVTSVIDAGGGFQNYPEDYEIIQELQRRGELSLRIAYNLFAQRAGQELEDFRRWTTLIKPGDGDAFYRHNGAGENLVMSAADFEDFLQPRPDLSGGMDAQLEAVVTLLAQQRWPFRLHATYDESIEQFLAVFERVNRAVPLNGLRWFFDHAETVSDRNLERIRALGGGIAVQHRMAYQGEYFIQRYGAAAARRTPPLRRMLNLGLPVGAGTDGTRVASYNPWVAFSWMISGRTLGGTELYDGANLLTRAEALRLLTTGSAYFSGEEQLKGRIAPGQYADFAILSRDCLSIPADETRGVQSLLTAVDGRVVYAAEPYRAYAPPPLPISPDWAPPREFGGYQGPAAGEVQARIGGHGCDCFVF